MATGIRSPSVFFNNYTYQPRQKMLEDLLDNAIRQSGVVLKYIPRDNFVRDELFGDDPYKKFTKAINMAAYPKSVDNFEGQGDFLSKFGLNIQDQIVFTISVRMFTQMRYEKLLLEHDSYYQNEDRYDYAPSQFSSIILEDGNREGYYIDFAEPRAGDLLYFAMVDKIFEITHVEHENLFYNHGILLSYDLKCELFKYSNEEMETGYDYINSIETLLSTDRKDDNIIQEDGDALDLEDVGELTLEDDGFATEDKVSDNDTLQKNANEIVDFSEGSPFSETDRW